MKHKRFIHLACSVVVASLVASCDLDREPKTTLARENSMKTYADATSWHAGVMQRIRSSAGGDYVFPQDAQADELTPTLNYGNNYGAFADWSLLQADNNEARDVYAGCYTRIKNTNLVLEDMPKLLEAGSGLTDKEKSSVTTYIGEAHFARAYSYLMLALRYGKMYSASTAEQDLSVPLHTRYDYEAKPPRATNKEVYSLILADIAQAEKNLASVTGVANASKLTIDAVKALKARTLLYMGNFADALQTANELINSSTYALMSASEDNMRNMWFADGEALKESILQPNVSFPDEPNNTIGLYLYPDNKTSSFKPSYLPTKAIYDLYEATDTRKAVYFWAGEKLSIDGVDYTDLVLVGKWRGNPTYAQTANDRWGKVPDYRLRPKVFRIAEQYLIAAEAAYRMGGDALTPLNALRGSRGLTAVNASGEALLQAIQEERQRELAFEGFRLFDLRRWGKDVVRKDPQTSASGNSFVVSNLSNITYKVGDNKFVWPIPAQDVKVGKLIQNPGY